MYKYGSAAAWGTTQNPYTPMFDTAFANALRLVGHDMNVADYLDTGYHSYQIPPTWWA